MEAKEAHGDWRGFMLANHVNLIVIEPDLYPALADALRNDDGWSIIVDDATAVQPLPGNRLFIAIRKKPV